jgi:hypothetical protein
MNKFLSIAFLMICAENPTEAQQIKPDSSILQFVKEQVKDMSNSRGLDAGYFSFEKFEKSRRWKMLQQNLKTDIVKSRI